MKSTSKVCFPFAFFCKYSSLDLLGLCFLHYVKDTSAGGDLTKGNNEISEELDMPYNRVASVIRQLRVNNLITITKVTTKENRVERHIKITKQGRRALSATKVIEE